MKHLYQRFFPVTLFLVCTLFSQRLLANQFTVTNNSNAGAGSLVDAIAAANAHANALDTVVFNIPEGQSFTIIVTATIDITDSLFIDGYSQPGAAQGDPRVARATVRHADRRRLCRARPVPVVRGADSRALRPAPRQG